MFELDWLVFGWRVDQGRGWLWLLRIRDEAFGVGAANGVGSLLAGGVDLAGPAAMNLAGRRQADARASCSAAGTRTMVRTGHR